MYLLKWMEILPTNLDYNWDHPYHWCWRDIPRITVLQTKGAHTKHKSTPTVTQRDSEVILQVTFSQPKKKLKYSVSTCMEMVGPF